MTRHSHLPVYKSCYVLVREIFRVQEKLPKNLKHSLGEMLFESALRCLKGIVIANGSTHKVSILQEISTEIDVIWTYLRLLYDFKGISKGEFQLLSERVSEISPQIAAWKKWEKERIRTEIKKT